MHPERSSTSPTGRYVVQISAWEVRMSHWIEAPELIDTTSGERLIRFRDAHWSLSGAEWRDDSTVYLTLRKYPGAHTPALIGALVDCEERQATLNTGPVCRLEDFEQTLDRALR